MNIINPYRFAAAGTAFDGFGNASRSFDGVNDYIDLGDSDDFTFSNGSNDTPFSACAWVKAVDWSSFFIWSKYTNNSSLKEWYLGTTSGDLLYFQLNDGNGSVRIGRSCSGALTSYQNAWVHIAATYDGSGSSTGINIYLTEFGGTTTAIDTTDYNNGSYVTMDNTTEPLWIGRLGSAEANGKIADARLYSKELSSAEVQDLADGVHVTDSLLGWWLDDDDDVLDNAGTNDGQDFGTTYDADGPAD